MSRQETWKRFLEKYGRNFDEIKGSTKEDLRALCKKYDFDAIETIDVLTTFEEERILALTKPITTDAPWKSIFTHGLPPLGSKTCSGSTSSTYITQHEPAKIVIHTFERNKSLNIDPKPSPLWVQKDFINQQNDYTSEIIIQTRVETIIQEVIAGLNLSHLLSTAPELSVFRLQADIWAVTKAGSPVGVIQVKKPGHGVLEHPKVLGQMYDYLWRLKSYHGLIDCFGLLSTYEEWRVVWLPSSSGELSSQPTQHQCVEVDELKEGTTQDSSPPPETTSEVNMRQVQGSKIYQWNDEELPLFLATTIHRMCYSETRPVLRIDPQRPYIHMNEQMWRWGTYNWKDFKLRYDEIPTNDATEFILLEDLRGGEDGRLWLGCTLAGRAAVIKFSQRRYQDEAKQALEQEAETWRLLYSEEFPIAKHTRVVRLGGDWALLMPYMKCVVNKAENATSEIRQAVDERIEKLAQSKLCHNDLEWRHIGILSREGKPKAIFFDLADVSSEDDSCAASLKMRKRLNLEE